MLRQLHVIRDKAGKHCFHPVNDLLLCVFERFGNRFIRSLARYFECSMSQVSQYRKRNHDDQEGDNAKQNRRSADQCREVVEAGGILFCRWRHTAYLDLLLLRGQLGFLLRP